VRVQGLLTKKQRETLTKMVGEPFDLNEIRVSTLPAPDAKNPASPAASDREEKTKARALRSPELSGL